MSLDLTKIGPAYGFHVIDYERPGSGVVLSSGDGFAMAAMDAFLCCRWSCVFDPPERPDRLLDWFAWLNRLTSPVVVAGSFGLTHELYPGLINEALAAIEPAKLFCYSIGYRHDFPEGVRQYDHFDQLQAAVDAYATEGC